ncbi:MAG: efflux RND transporter permease subunit, partial [bacterium]
MSSDSVRNSGGIVGAIVERFLDSKLSILLLIVATVLGVASIYITPREEEPQIIVPMADVIVQYPGASAAEVEKLVATPLERLMWQIDGVEYVYSISRRDMAVVTVRFYVGENREDSLLKLYNKIEMNIDQAPPGVTGWVVKPVEIDDVPIITLTLTSKDHSDFDLRRIGEEVLARLDGLEDLSRTYIVGGRRREARVEVDQEKLAGYGLSLLEVQRAIAGADASLSAGEFDRSNTVFSVRSGPFLRSVNEVDSLVVGVYSDRPVYLSDVARITDGPEEAVTYSRIGFGPARDLKSSTPDWDGTTTYPAVTLALSKKKGTNAVWVAESILERVEELKKEVIPSGVEVVLTRDYGETANDKVNELIEGLIVAVITVVGLLAFTLGWRAAAIVALAIPITYFLTLFFNMIFGYTINRVTLFALTMSLGLLVDDPIVDVENIYRHFRMRLRPARESVLFAVNEVRPPIILATLAVIFSFLPMFFITGMMGPYMGPMALNVPLTMLMSMVVAFTITPWLSYHLLRGRYGKVDEHEESFDLKASVLYRVYARVLEPFLSSRFLSWMLVFFVVLLLLGSAALGLLRVPLKMLPFDNKNEFQLVLDLPEGTTLETTDAAVRAFEDYLRTVPEVTDFISYVGTSSPMDFNGMVRHYYFRNEPNMADIRINLAHKDHRVQQSHALTLRLRNDIEKIARDYHVNAKIVESPPGPPVIATLVAEVYGRPDTTYNTLLVTSK